MTWLILVLSEGIFTRLVFFLHITFGMKMIKLSHKSRWNVDHDHDKRATRLYRLAHDVPKPFKI